MIQSVKNWKVEFKKKLKEKKYIDRYKRKKNGAAFLLLI